ncbi:MAG: PASTA domain-containing protein [Clostridia bacterium]|nr:PASTA domain-containing protein [Clostridia bacterium]
MAKRPERQSGTDEAPRTVSTEAVRRSTWLGLLIFFVFAVLLVRILLIQTVGFEDYQNKVLEQITTESKVPAARGKIYDRNGNVLATNITTYRVFVSPSGIKSAQEGSDGEEDYATLVAKGLSEILGVNQSEVEEEIREYADKLDRTIKRRVDEETADLVREYIDEHGLQTMIYLEAQSTRYYPGKTLAAHMLGFTSQDGVGLYGLEYQYDEYLKGVDGYYIKARDSYGNEMPNDYSSYIKAIDGYNLTTTIDTTVQSFLEEQLEATVLDHEAANRACGIVIDVKTGGILAMATSSPFDLNDPWGLDPLSKATLAGSGYAEGSDEYAELQRTLLTEMWSNKAVTESYIPGSTFKIVTSAMALEERKESIPSTVHCPGHKIVLGQRIHCHKVQGHGSIDFATGLQQSCNVWFMTLGELIGVDTYQQYVKAFGYKERTGIDLPGEGYSIFASEMSQLDLAIYAFGQNFNVTPLQQLCAVAAVANDGKLMQPYIVERVSDNAGNVIYQHKVTAKRQVVSEQICDEISKILEDGVSGTGGAKNAYVAGYRVAAKTGTSEKKGAAYADHEAYICSTVAYAPADDPEIAIIIIVDEPTRGVLYGSTVAAPYIAGALENIMPYLGIIPKYSETEQSRMSIVVPYCTSMTLDEAIAKLRAEGLDYTVVGSTDSAAEVTSQSPSPYVRIAKSSNGKVVLYTNGEAPNESAIVPDLTGRTAVQANGLLTGAGLNIRIMGTTGIGDTNGRVLTQSIAPGTKVKPGTVVQVTFGEKEDLSDG